MTGVYIDTSILGGYYCQEQDSKAIESILLEIHEPVVSILSEVEFASLISKKQRMRELTETSARKVLFRFQSHFDQGFFCTLSLSRQHYLMARNLIADFQLGLRTLDALHLALVLENKLRLFTADKIFAAAAKNHGVETETV